jgi:hypothetical protein
MKIKQLVRVGCVVAAALAAYLAVSQSARASNHAGDPLEYSCPDKPYLELSASLPGHAAFPEVELQVMDGQRRTTGFGDSTKRIPRSSYRRLVEIPDAPDNSKAVAIEICDAKPDSYELLVLEKKQESYILTLRGVAASGTHSATMPRFAQPERTCRYRFVFAIMSDSIRLEWTDKFGKPIGAGADVPCEIVR